MEKILDKTILFICCGIYLFSQGFDEYTVVPLAVMLSLAAMNVAFDVPVVHIFTYVIYLILSCFYPDLIYFYPIIGYELFIEPYKYTLSISVVAVYFWMDNIENRHIVWVIVVLAMAYFMKRRTALYLKVRKEMYMLQDELSEQKDRLQLRNRELMEKQDYEVTNAMLGERNRIAREIHDTVGHLLSSSILQIGALIAITKDEQQKAYLSQIKDTMSEGMNNIRASIHNIHEESMDLEVKLKSLIDNFNFCEVKLNYKINNDFSMKAKYSLLFIVKEALSNVMKHSNATAVEVLFSELPAYYQIVIKDNGTGKYRNEADKESGQRGMGLSGICDRVNGLEGNINITKDNGYKIFITLPK